jgi:hypothetical protein
MIELETGPYEAWLSSPDAILDQLRRYFELEITRIRWGKLMLIGRRRAELGR